MLTKDIRDSMLVDELQLGERLNNALQSHNQADFALMLSLISQDVTDSAIFTKPEENKTTDADLRVKFGLAPAQKLYAESDDLQRAEAISDMFVAEGASAVFLQECMVQEPLVPFEQIYSPEVLNSLTPLKQEKLRQSMAGKVLEYEKIAESGDGFDVLDEINQSVTQMKKAEAVA